MKGLSFSEPMVKAWMEGRKSITRRLIRQANHPIDGPAGAVHAAKVDGFIAWWPGNVTPEFTKSVYERGFLPRYTPGETVYIQESWCAIDLTSGYALKNQPKSKEGVCLDYRDGCTDFTDSLVHKWFPPRFMPAWAARYFRKILSAEPQRLQEITEADAKAEGCDFGGWTEDGSWATARYNFEYLWDSISPQHAWKSNYWVWKYCFEKAERPHDQ